MIDQEARRQAERENDMQRRLMERGQARQPAAFNQMSDGEYSEQNQPLMRQRPQDDNFEDQDLGNFNDYGDNKENLSAWIQKPEVIAFIRRKFSTFLRTFTDENE